MKDGDGFDFILDAYALLAFFDDEPGAQRVQEYLESAESGELALAISLIDLGEVVYIVERERGLEQAKNVLSTIRSLPITLLSVDERVVLAAAHIKANHRISYADAFAAASVHLWGGRLVTGDPEFRPLEDEQNIAIEWLR